MTELASSAPRSSSYFQQYDRPGRTRAVAHGGGRWSIGAGHGFCTVCGDSAGGPPSSWADKLCRCSAKLPISNLTERSGQEIQLAHLRGKVWVADFIFTYCAGPCPQMTQQMATLQRDWAKENGVRMVSISVDPQRDTPTRLQEYATEHGALPERWLFLTGEMSGIQKLAVGGFKLGSVEDPILHSTKFALVDRVGNIRGYYEGTSDEGTKSLKKRKVWGAGHTINFELAK